VAICCIAISSSTTDSGLTNCQSRNNGLEGTGIISDRTGTFADTPADFSVAYSSGSGVFTTANYSFTLTASEVPEPSVYGALAGALAMLPFGLGRLRHRRKPQAT
jgi:hypothetical protein